MVGMKIDLGGIRALRFTVSERAMWLEDEKTGERIRLGDKPSSAGHLAGMLLGDVLARADTWLVMNGTYGLGLQPMKFMDEYRQSIVAPLKDEMELLLAERDSAIAGRCANSKEVEALRARLVFVARERDAALREHAAKTKDVDHCDALNANLNKEVDDLRAQMADARRERTSVTSQVRAVDEEPKAAPAVVKADAWPLLHGVFERLQAAENSARKGDTTSALLRVISAVRDLACVEQVPVGGK